MDVAGGHTRTEVWGCGECLGEAQILPESGKGWEGRIGPMTPKEEMMELTLTPRCLT